MAICRNCGQDIYEQVKFCPNCGIACPLGARSSVPPAGPAYPLRQKLRPSQPFFRRKTIGVSGLILVLIACFGLVAIDNIPQLGTSSSLVPKAQEQASFSSPAQAVAESAPASSDAFSSKPCGHCQADRVNAMTVDDFILSQTKLVGKVVGVSGFPTCINGEECVVDDPNNDNFVSFKNNLPMADIKILLNCDDILNQCPATVIGTVETDGMGDFEIDATHIIWRSEDN